MNKISKKILAIVTMAAFVVTMMPFAAFAAEPADVQTSEFHVVDRNGDVLDEVSVDAKDTVTAQFIINDGEGIGTNADLIADVQKVKIWAVDNKTQQVTSALVVTPVDGDATSPKVEKCGDNRNVYKVMDPTNNGDKVNISFNRAGEYTVYAGVGDFGENGSVAPIEKLQGDSVVIVEGTTNEVATVTVNGAPYEDGEVVPVINVGEDFIANGIDTYTITGVAKDEKGNFVRNATFTLDTNKSGIDLEETTVKTNNVGEFEITFSMTKADTYRIYVDGDISLTLQVKKAADTKIDTITNTTENAKTLLAGTDKNFAEAAEVSLADAVQFTLAYDNGVELSNTEADQIVIDAEPAADLTDAAKHSKYLSIEQKPEKSKLTAGDLKLAWSSAKEAYTLVYVGNQDADKDLLAGEYTVKVALTSGKSAEATFTLAKFGTVQDLAIDMNVLTSGTVANPTLGADITDEVVLGNKVFGTVKYVDENGIEVTANKATVQVGINGAAIESGNTENNLPDFGITTKATDNENLLGTVITVTAFDTKVGKMVAAELTVVDGKTANTLAFDSENGEANKTNTVEVSIVDEDGDLVRETGDMYAYIADQSNEDANIEVTPAGTNGVKNGKGDLKIFSDKETTVDVVVAVKVGNAVYAKTLSYTVGAEDINADTTVVMTIGSSDIVVNNDVVTGDAAPFVDSNWRTMVPVRALSQSFGGSAEWDGDARTVTVENGDTTIVFTADSDKYTVNGEEKTMDTELTIVDGRTYVPVKFVAEELGYTVTALKDAAGLTASVVIQK